MDKEKEWDKWVGMIRYIREIDYMNSSGWIRSGLPGHGWEFGVYRAGRDFLPDSGGFYLDLWRRLLGLGFGELETLLEYSDGVLRLGVWDVSDSDYLMRALLMTEKVCEDYRIRMMPDVRGIAGLGSGTDIFYDRDGHYSLNFVDRMVLRNYLDRYRAFVLSRYMDFDSLEVGVNMTLPYGGSNYLVVGGGGVPCWGGQPNYTISPNYTVTPTTGGTSYPIHTVIKPSIGLAYPESALELMVCEMEMVEGIARIYFNYDRS